MIEIKGSGLNPGFRTLPQADLGGTAGFCVGFTLGKTTSVFYRVFDLYQK